MWADILLIARNFTSQLAKYPHVLYAKPSNKVYLFDCLLDGNTYQSYQLFI